MQSDSSSQLPRRVSGTFAAWSMTQRLVVGITAVALVCAASFWLFAAHRAAASTVIPIGRYYPNPIVQENKTHPGTTGWRLHTGGTAIEAYANKDSINTVDPANPSVSESFTLHVSESNAADSSYDIATYRLGYYNNTGGTLVNSQHVTQMVNQGYYPLTATGGKYAPTLQGGCQTCTYDTEFSDSYAVKGTPTTVNAGVTMLHWAATLPPLTLPAHSVSGLYEILLTAHPSGNQWIVPLVVRDDSATADLIMVDPVNTDQAYNAFGGTSLYSNFRSTNPAPHAYKVSLDRPNMINHGAGNLFSWTFQMAEYLERQGFNVRYTTDTAIASGKTTLTKYKGIVLVGHNEYIDANERAALQNAVNSGVSLANFAGNSMYYQVRFEQNYRVMVGYKEQAQLDPYNQPGSVQPALTSTYWRSAPVNAPEDQLLKAEFNSDICQTGDGTIYNQDLALVNTTHWIFTKVNLPPSHTIKGILAYEVDRQMADGSIGANDHVTDIAQETFYNGNPNATPPPATDTVDSLVDELPTGNIIFDAGTEFWSIGVADTTFPSYDVLHNPITQYNPNDSSTWALTQMTNNILFRMITGHVPGSSVGGTPVSVPIVPTAHP